MTTFIFKVCFHACAVLVLYLQPIKSTTTNEDGLLGGLVGGLLGGLLGGGNDDRNGGHDEPPPPENSNYLHSGNSEPETQTQPPVTSAPQTTKPPHPETDNLPFNISLACFKIDEKELDDILTNSCCRRTEGSCKRFATAGREAENHCLGKVRNDEINFDFCCRITRHKKGPVYHANITESQSKLKSEPNCEIRVA